MTHAVSADALFAELDARLKDSRASPYFMQMTATYRKADVIGMYDASLRMFGRSLQGAVCVDLGCKFGHTLALMLAMGAREAIGVDAHEPYIREGEAFIGTAFPKTRFIVTRDGLIDLPPASVDCIYVNEVISHVNPTLLPLLYNEMNCILKPGGILLISDGNNFANASCRMDLLALYDAWENGPAGRNTGRDIVHKSFRAQRKTIIRQLAPQLDEAELEYVTANTFGLFGMRLEAVVAGFVSEKKLVERPYRPGIAPTNPGAGGYVMERWFHPREVELDLASWGFSATQVYPKATHSVTGLKGILVSAFLFARNCIHRLFPEWRRGEAWGFVVRAVKN